jgi:predicted ATPase/DNA-binding CsgD family transcriptional regulator
MVMSSALVQHETYRKLLREELDVEPAVETQALYESIRVGALEALLSPPDDAGKRAPSHNLPVQATSFVGRAAELAKLRGMLVDANCRMLTLVGPGGIGKTRLAVEAARQQTGVFPDGVFFIPLQGVLSPDFLVSTIADALQIALRSQAEPRAQLLGQLSHRHTLMVLDSLEHLLAEPWSGQTVGLLGDILRVAPGVTLLVTSREVLNLREEWVFPVHGLPFPRSRQADDAQAPEAMALFAERSRRVRADFSLGDEQAGVVRICQLVEGIPLALELAASWVRTLSCAAIAGEIERNLSFLATTQRDVPKRHRSLQAVFDQSWALLTEEERAVFRRLSVFRGGFRRQAAEAVGGATLPVLAALVDKSLLQPQPDGRYHIHECFRHCAETHLLDSPAEAARLREAHCTYYCSFLDARRDSCIGLNQRDVVREIREETKNIRAAWRHAVLQAKAEEIQRAAYTLFNIFDFLGRYRESHDLFQQAVQALESTEPGREARLALAEVLAYQGWFHIRLGQLERSREVLERSRALYGRLHATHPPGFGSDPRTALGIVACIEGDYAEAARLGDAARQIAEANGDLDNLATACYVLASAALGQHEYEAARDYAQQAHVMARPRSPWFAAYCLNVLGEVAEARADYAEAAVHFRASYGIRRELDDLEGMAVALRHLADTACRQENYLDARQLYSHALALYQNIDDQGGLVAALQGLGRAAVALGDTTTALEHCRQALRTVAKTQLTPLKLSVLADVGALMLETHWRLGAPVARGDEPPSAPAQWVTYPERGVELLALVRGHPASDQGTRQRAEQLLGCYETAGKPELVAAIQRGEAADLEEAVVALRAELAKLAAGAPVGERVPASADEHPYRELVEPLTAREVEVLELLAQGLSNREIADHLVLTVGTVKWYASQIYSKLNVHSRTQAIARARQLKMVS